MLSSSRLVAFVPSTDLERSRSFYENVLGLPVRQADSFAVVARANDIDIRITNVGADLSVQPFTVLGWEVDDIYARRAELAERGVSFMQVDTIDQDEHGVWSAPDGTKVAWFSDPDGNTLSLSQH